MAPNPSFHPTCYGLRPPHAGELKRYSHGHPKISIVFSESQHPTIFGTPVGHTSAKLARGGWADRS
jgi:hypothetical protein